MNQVIWPTIEQSVCQLLANKYNTWRSPGSPTPTLIREHRYGDPSTTHINANAHINVNVRSNTKIRINTNTSIKIDSDNDIDTNLSIGRTRRTVAKAFSRTWILFRRWSKVAEAMFKRSSSKVTKTFWYGPGSPKQLPRFTTGWSKALIQSRHTNCVNFAFCESILNRLSAFTLELALGTWGLGNWAPEAGRSWGNPGGGTVTGPTRLVFKQLCEKPPRYNPN